MSYNNNRIQSIYGIEGTDFGGAKLENIGIAT